MFSDISEKKAKKFKNNLTKLDELLKAIKESVSLVDNVGIAPNALLSIKYFLSYIFFMIHYFRYN
jgi:hypothetical protein